MITIVRIGQRREVYAEPLPLATRINKRRDWEKIVKRSRNKSHRGLE
jgi:hypothetical protein